ncbi:MAG: glycosyltransferase family 2 protein [Nodosilinea sp. WJT8-NPBG4]|jgi:glycosyltransferase involved in cell wall biosynthesis|nr:glycosyltransferase family 2 protein [Nodosilinea sp. WJT8-NPBG4]
MPTIDVLIPTYNRPDALAVTLTSLCAQTYTDFRVIVSDQSEDQDVADVGTIQTVVRVLAAHHTPAQILKHLPRRGISEQRHFLLNQATAPYVLFLDDDVLLEPWVLKLLLNTIERESCGFVGNPPIGLSYIDDVRPNEHQPLTFWEGPVQPETLRQDTPEWERWRLHNAANPYHLQQRFGLTPRRPSPYHVAWVAGCVLFNRAKLLAIGGFSFWQDLPAQACGEDVLVQQRVMQRYGGCGVLPSGAYHQELPTTLHDRSQNAPNLLPL